MRLYLLTTLLLGFSPLTTQATLITTNSPTPAQPAAISSNEQGATNPTSKKSTLNLIRKNSVNIHSTCYARSKQNDWNSSDWNGAGFLIDKEQGLILTNKNVINELGVCTYLVKFSNGTTLEAKRTYISPLYNYAFLKISDLKEIPKDAATLTFLTDPIKLNENIYIIGRSDSDELPIYEGYVSDDTDNDTPFGEQSFRFSMTTDHNVIGSPVFSSDGRIAGITQSFTSALSSSYFIQALEDLKKGQEPMEKTLGFFTNYTKAKKLQEGGLLPKDALELYQNTFPEASNKILWVISLLPGTEAYNQVNLGDVLWAIKTKDMTKPELVGPYLSKFHRIISQAKDPVLVQLYRDGVLKEMTLTPQEVSSKNFNKMVVFANGVWVDSNPKIKLLTGDSEKGIYLTHTASNSPLKEMKGNDEWKDKYLKILSINGQKLSSLEDLIKLIPSLSTSKTLTIHYVIPSGYPLNYGYKIYDRHPKIIVLNYNPEYDIPRSYEFNNVNSTWVSTLLYKGNQESLQNNTLQPASSPNTAPVIAPTKENPSPKTVPQSAVAAPLPAQTASKITHIPTPKGPLEVKK